MHTVAIKDKSEFIAIARKQDWLDSDKSEIYELGGKNIPTTFGMLNKNPLMYLVMEDGDILTMFALQDDNQFIYFNTNAVRKRLKTYLRFLRTLVSYWLKQRPYLTIWALNNYTTTNKKLKWLGFRKINVLRTKTQWIAGA